MPHLGFNSLPRSPAPQSPLHLVDRSALGRNAAVFRAAASTQTTVGEISDRTHLTHRFFL